MLFLTCCLLSAANNLYKSLRFLYKLNWKLELTGDSLKIIIEILCVGLSIHNGQGHSGHFSIDGSVGQRIDGEEYLNEGT